MFSFYKQTVHMNPKNVEYKAPDFRNKLVWNMTLSLIIALQSWDIKGSPFHKYRRAQVIFQPHEMLFKLKLSYAI